MVFFFSFSTQFDVLLCGSIIFACRLFETNRKYWRVHTRLDWTRASLASWVQPGSDTAAVSGKRRLTLTIFTIIS